MIDIAADLLFNQKVNFKEAFLAFLKESLKMIAQSYIETEIRIANERRVQEEVNKTSLLQLLGMQKSTQAAMGTKSIIDTLAGSLKGLFGGSVAGGGAAMAGAGLLFPTEMGNLFSGIGGAGSHIKNFFNRGVDGLLSDFEGMVRKEFGTFDDYRNDMFAGSSGRKMVYDIIKAQATKSARDQQGFFNANFKDEFMQIMKGVGNTSGSSTSASPNITVVVQNQITDGEIREIAYAIDALIDEKRVTRS